MKINSWDFFHILAGISYTYVVYYLWKRKSANKKVAKYMDKLKETYYNDNRGLTDECYRLLTMIREELEQSKEKNIVFERL